MKGPSLDIDLIVVRLQDLISKRTYKFNETYNQIIEMQGLHNFLNFKGEILLSLIMKDRIIPNLNPERYSEAIHLLKPNSFTTVDGETYESDFDCARAELERITRENDELLKLAPEFKPVGLVKGCSEKTIENHAKQLKTKGIDELIFHVSDFSRHGKPVMIKRARLYSRKIRPHAKNLMLYGLGSPNLFNQFCFADRYVTLTHYVTAMKGKKFTGCKTMKYSGGCNEEIITKNFDNIHNIIKSMEHQKKLS